MRLFIFSLGLFFICKISLGQGIPEISSIKRDYKLTLDLTLKRSFNGNSYDFMSTRRVIGGNNTLLKVKYDKDIFDQQIELINRILSSSSPTNDGFRGWISLHKGERSTFKQEVPLYESYSFIYVAEFLYLSQKNGWLEGDSNLITWHEKVVSFLEKNIWEKWRVRSQKTNKNANVYFLRNRTHMGSHWAGIARFLYLITRKQEIKSEAKEVYTQYDILLRRNLRKVDNRYLWNSTYDNVDDTDAIRSRQSVVQDVSHGNHVIAYVVLANELGDGTWKLSDMKLFANTLKYLFNSKTNTFYDIIDRSNATSFIGWGNYIADGWLRLAKYDDELKLIMQQFSNRQDLLKKYNQEFQFVSNMAYYCL